MSTRPLGAIAVLVLVVSQPPVRADREQAPPVDFTKFAPLTPGAGDGDYIIGPPYANAPELTPRDGVPKGAVYRFTMSSTDSKIYPGISKTAPGQVVPYQRRVTVYVPRDRKSTRLNSS